MIKRVAMGVCAAVLALQAGGAWAGQCHALPSGADGILNLSGCPHDVMRLTEREAACFYVADENAPESVKAHCDVLERDKEKIRVKYRSNPAIITALDAALCSITTANEHCQESRE